MTETTDQNTDADGRDSTSTDTSPTSEPIEASTPPEFGLVQAWWGDGKGKTTAAIGMGMRAVGHGYRVHMIQFLKGGTDNVENVRGEYNAIEELPGFTYENTGHFGWHGFPDGSEDGEHETNARKALARAEVVLEAAKDVDLTEPIPLGEPPERGVHMLILDEILYMVQREMIDEAAVVDMISNKPRSVELVLTGGHHEPTFLEEHADLVSEVRKHKHPIEAGQAARKGTEY